jgi:class 3 adenylate cyclase
MIDGYVLMTSNQKTQLLCILFSDLKGYSGLRDDRLKNQIVQEMKAIAIRNSKPGVELIKTIGDGLMMCCPTPLPLAETALRLRDIFKTTDWKAKGFPEDLLIRIGLHVDEMIVHYRDDATIEDVIGTGVDATARIEPITEPNAVFCSARFYEMLQGRGTGKIKGLPQGQRALAKDYGEMELYELRWMHEPDEAERQAVQQAAALSIPMPLIKKSFTDKDRKDFLHYAFGIIRDYFMEAVKQLQNSTPGIESVVTPINNVKFTCEIYLNGQVRTRCKVWIGSMMGTPHECILYSEGYRSIDDDNSSNDMLLVQEDGQKMYLKSSFGAMFSRRGPDTTKPSSPEQVAEYLWLRLTQILER